METQNNIESIEKLKGKGLIYNHENLQVGSSIIAHLFQCSFHEPVTLYHHFENAKNTICINFCLSGKTQFRSEHHSIAGTDTNMMNNFLLPCGHAEQELHLTPQLSLISCFIDPPVFQKLIGNADSVPEDLPRINNRKNFYFEFYNWQPIAKSILQKMFCSEMRPAAQKIFLESKILELFAIVAGVYSKHERQFAISGKDADGIKNNNRLFLKNIIYPADIAKATANKITGKNNLKKNDFTYTNLQEFPI
jgi:hypothetical protein